MKAAVLHGPFDIDIEDVDIPQIKPDDVLVKIIAAGICGSDLHFYEGKLSEIVKPPRILGHEFSGEVFEIGEEVEKFRKGDRVTVEPVFGCGRCSLCLSGKYNVCRDYKLIGVHVDGGFAEFVSVPENQVFKIPDDLSYEEGALIEPSAVALHALKRAEIHSDDFVVVIGAGVVGLQMVQIAKIFGARVMSMDLLDYKLELAKRFGADSVVNVAREDPIEAVADASEGTGADIVIESAGPAISKTTDLIKPGGKIVLVGLGPRYAPIDVRAQVLYEYEILGSHVYCGSDFPEVISLASKGKIQLKPLITHRLTLQEVKKGFEILENKLGDPIKVMLLG